MELRELRLVVGRYLPLAYAVFAICVAIGCATAFLPEKSYRTSSTIVLDVNNNPDTGGGSVQQVNFLLPALEVRAQSRTMRELAASDVLEEFRRVRVDINAQSDASVLRIVGESSSPRAAQAWVNAISDRLVEDQPATSPVILGVLDPAPLKRQAVSPNVEPILAAFVVLGIILGLFSTLAADRIQRAFDTNRTVRDRIGTTVLGEVPVRRRRSERKLPIVSLLDGRSSSPAMVGAFEAVRTNVDFRMRQAGADNIVVISVSREADKSMITAGLAFSMAHAGRHTVAIEADVREPSLATQLRVSPREGLGDVAAFGLDSLVVHGTKHPLLEVVPAGLPAGRAADVVTSALPGVIETLSGEDTTLVVDGPILRGAPESAAVIAQVGFVVLVVNSGSTAYSELSEAIELINDAGGTLLGVVVNGVSRRRIQRDDGSRSDLVVEHEATQSPAMSGAQNGVATDAADRGSLPAPDPLVAPAQDPQRDNG
ncbi:MAG: hypothetical protein AB8G26_06240 [Ilumatobacter sp.]